MNLSYTVGDHPERVAANRRMFFGMLGVQENRLAQPLQSHSATILKVETGGRYPSCDGLMTSQPDLWLAVSIADCVPVVLVDPQKEIVAALHAGWRGTLQRIVEKGVQQMVRDFGTEPADIIAYIGPSAGVCCYEVGPEVADQFTEGVTVRNNGSIHLNLKKENENQLLQRGVLQQHIEVSRHCTICTPSLFHSYRRDKERSGRMLAVVGLASPQ